MNEETRKAGKKMACCHKTLRRTFRRCAAMAKIAFVMLIFIFMFGLMETNVDDIKRSADTDVRIMSRRQVMQLESKVENYDVTSTRKQSTESKESKTNLVVRIASKKATETVNIAEQGLAAQIRPKMPGNTPPHSTEVEYRTLRTKEWETQERENRKIWSERIKAKEFATVPPNPSFIFHNKLPKSGSSTMNNILKKLSKENNFNFQKIETEAFASKATDDNYLINYLKGKIEEPFLLLKHHRFLNFTALQQPQPTYINVMRDPLEWFTSHYYFSRYGWVRKPGCRKEDCGMTKEDRAMEVDECVKKRHRECINPRQYLQFFCGTSPECYDISTVEQKLRATELAKKNILNEYYLVGVLEQFEDSLRVLEVVLPDYFKTAVTTWKSDFVQEKQNMTRTTYKSELSEESKQFLRDGPLHFEIELYNFARELFNERMKRLNMKSTLSE